MSYLFIMRALYRINKYKIFIDYKELIVYIYNKWEKIQDRIKNVNI